MANKNECGKTRPQDNPYEVWKNNSGWEWLVLKKYQSPEKENKNPFARWFCAVKSPFTYGDYSLGDVYIADIINGAYRVDKPEEGMALKVARKGMPADPMADFLG